MIRFEHAFVATLLAATGLFGCSSDKSGDSDDNPGTGGASGSGGAGATADSGPDPNLDFDPTPADFECVKNGTKVRKFYVVNKLGKLDEALAVANNPNGGTYPVGTILQLVSFEAMVKRHAGFSPDTNDWEFFALGVSASGTEINARGTQDVVNQFNGNCFTCHAKAEPKWDFVCEDSHGCDPLGLTPEIIQQVQDSDPRCPAP